jgi:uncharacterized repeat protein (TIGR03803 family)
MSQQKHLPLNAARRHRGAAPVGGSPRMNCVAGEPTRRQPSAVEPLEDRRLFAATVATLATFNNTNGGNPGGGVIFDAAGNLYGTASSGGANGDGTVFEVAAGSGSVTTLASFDGTNGEDPQGGLIADAAGNLYGTASSDSVNGDGTVFEVAKGSGAITVLASFNATNGDDPLAALVADSAGNLYGTTRSGGSNFSGTVFEIAKGSGTVTTLATFNGTNGDGPEGSLIFDADGNLYGTTQNGGGTSGEGTVFEVAKGSGSVTTLATFNGTDGTQSQYGLIADTAGNLYGTTQDGGAFGLGTVFEVAQGSGTVTTLASFVNNESADTGELPSGGVIADAAGNLYGTTSGGGTNSDGTVFEVAKGSGSVTTLVTCDSTDSGPAGGLVADADGNLYGTSSGGGANSAGTVFEVSGTGFSTGTTTPTPTPTLTVTPAGGQFATAGTAQTFALGTLAETDATAPYTATVNWGDGSADTTVALTAAGTITAQPHTYAAAGTDTASVTVADAAGDTSNAGTFAVTVSPAPPVNTAGVTLAVTRSTLSPYLVGTAKLKGSITVDVDNGTGATLTGTGTVDLYAIDAAGAKTLVGTVKHGPFKSGKTTPVTVAAKPVVLPAGTYTVLPTLMVGSDTSTAATGTSITVAPATVTLAAAVTAVSPATLAAGKTVTITLSLTNTGNVNSTGAATAAVTLTATGTATTVTLPAVPAKTTVKFGGKPVVVKLKVKVPVGTAAATYDPTVRFTQGGNMATAVGTTPITVS